MYYLVRHASFLTRGLALANETRRAQTKETFILTIMKKQQIRQIFEGAERLLYTTQGSIVISKFFDVNQCQI